MKKVITIFVIFLLITGISGCEKTNVSKSVKKGVTMETSKNPGKGNEGNTKKVKKQELKMISNGENSCSNENGYYYIDTHGNEFELKNGKTAYHIMYIDYATRKEVFLCNNVGCKHNTEACTAVILDEYMLEHSLFFHNGKLYLLEKAYDDEGSMSYDTFSEEYSGFVSVGEEDNSQFLYCMNPDGTDRKKVLEFEKGISIGDHVLEDDSGLYIIEKKIKTQGSKVKYAVATEKKLVRIDDISGKKEIACDLMFDYPKKTSWSVIGCFDFYLVMEAYVMEHPLSEKEEMKAFKDSDYDREMSKKSKMEYAVVDITTGKMKKICSFSNEKTNSCAQKGRFLYVIVDGDKKIKQFDLVSGKESILAEIDNAVYCEIFDGKLKCSPWDENSKSCCFINLESGKVEKKTLNLTTKSLGWPLEFKGETEQYFLVVYDYKAEKAEQDPRDTGGDAYNIEQNKLALLNKEDYYNNKANFKPIDMIGSGGTEE